MGPGWVKGLGLFSKYVEVLLTPEWPLREHSTIGVHTRAPLPAPPVVNHHLWWKQALFQHNNGICKHVFHFFFWNTIGASFCATVVDSLLILHSCSYSFFCFCTYCCWCIGGLCGVAVAVVLVVEGRRSCRDLVSPCFSHKSDQRLKAESSCPLQQVYSRFQFNLLLNCPLCSPLCPQTVRYILMPIRSAGLTAEKEMAGRRTKLSTLCHSGACTAHWQEERESIYYNCLMSSRAINSLIIIICLIKLFASLSMGVTQISQ